MSKRIVICAICGNEFEATNSNSKYCSDACRKKGNYNQRKKWEIESGYKEAQRQKRAEERNRKNIEATARAEKEAKKRETNRKREETRNNNRIKYALEQAAEQGDHFAKMILAEQESGNTSPEYWQAFKEYELQYAKEWGKESTTTVNGISVNTKNFAVAVSISIEESGIVDIRKGSA